MAQSLWETKAKSSAWQEPVGFNQPPRRRCYGAQIPPSWRDCSLAVGFSLKAPARGRPAARGAAAVAGLRRSADPQNTNHCPWHLAMAREARNETWNDPHWWLPGSHVPRAGHTLWENETSARKEVPFKFGASFGSPRLCSSPLSPLSWRRPSPSWPSPKPLRPWKPRALASVGLELCGPPPRPASPRYKLCCCPGTSFFATSSACFSKSFGMSAGICRWRLAHKSDSSIAKHLQGSQQFTHVWPLPCPLTVPESGPDALSSDPAGADYWLALTWRLHGRKSCTNVDPGSK